MSDFEKALEEAQLLSIMKCGVGIVAREFLRLAEEKKSFQKEKAGIWNDGWAAGQKRYRYELGESAPKNPHL